MIIIRWVTGLVVAGRTVWSSSADKTIVIWDLGNLRVKRTLRDHSTYLRGIYYSFHYSLLLLSSFLFFILCYSFLLICGRNHAGELSNSFICSG